MKRARDGWSRLPTRGKWGAVALAFVVVIGIGAAIEGPKDEKQQAAKNELAPEPTAIRSMEEVEDELTPDLYVDIMELSEPRRMQKMCKALGVLGPELSLAAFKRGYEPPGSTSLKAADVFAAIIARC